LCLAAALVCALPLLGQNPDKRIFFTAGAGPSAPVSYTSDRLNTGFNLTGGVGVKLTPYVSLLGEFSFNRMGVTDAALAALSVPNGSARMYSLTASPMIHFNPSGRADPYVIAGGGFFRRTVEFTEPTVAVVGAFDPFYGVFFPVAVPANTVLGSFSQNKAAISGGGGISVRVREDYNAKIFAEGRYVYAFTTPTRTSLIPITIGVRW